MSDLDLAGVIVYELNRQRKESPAPVTAGHIATAAGLLYWGTWPAQPGYPSGKTQAEIRQMAIDLAAKCMQFVLEMEP